MNQVELDRKAYTLAKEFLLAIEGITPQLLEKYLQFSSRTPKPQTLSGIYLRLLESAQNANMKAGVIGGSIGGVMNLSQVLCNFETKLVLKSYRGWEDLLDAIEIQVKPRGSVRRTARSIWPQYCKSILSAATFLSRFNSANDFYTWVDFFDGDERARPALPLLIAQEIDGIGFPLACDFFKELGYANFGKPDVHLKDIFQELELCEGRNDLAVFRTIVRIAENVGVTPYNVDKVFWLIGSGNFYDDSTLGKAGKIGSRKRAFIKAAKPLLMS